MTIGSFLWGSGGRRLTPEDITRERALAARAMQTDYSPVAHWTQGLARVSENLMGALRNRRADRASEANMTDQQRIMAALMNPPGATPPIAPTAAPTSNAASASPIVPPTPVAAGPEGMGQVSDVVSALSDTAPVPAAGPSAMPGAPTAAPAATPPINPAIMEALSSPYVSDEVRQLAQRQYQEATRRVPPVVVNGHLLDGRTLQPIADYSAEAEPEVVRLLRAGGVDPTGAEGQSMLRRYAEGRTDPIVSIPLPDGRTYVGPRSGLPGSVGAGAGRRPPATLPPDFDFDQGGPTPPASGGFPW